MSARMTDPNLEARIAQHVGAITPLLEQRRQVLHDRQGALDEEQARQHALENVSASLAALAHPLTPDVPQPTPVIEGVLALAPIPVAPVPAAAVAVEPSLSVPVVDHADTPRQLTPPPTVLTRAGAWLAWVWDDMISRGWEHVATNAALVVILLLVVALVLLAHS